MVKVAVVIQIHGEEMRMPMPLQWTPLLITPRQLRTIDGVAVPGPRDEAAVQQLRLRKRSNNRRQGSGRSGLTRQREQHGRRA